MNIRVYNIKWDLEDEETGLTVDINEEGLPEETIVELPDDTNSIDIDDDISEYLSNEYGFCVKNFDWKLDTVEDRIRVVLRRYFEYNDNGDANPEFNEYFSAEEAIDEIHDIIGEI